MHPLPQDYITVYDGYTTRDPIILKICGGGQAIPQAISSGPELLVEFTTSPYGTFNTPQTSGHSLHGFQLEVKCTTSFDHSAVLHSKYSVLLLHGYSGFGTLCRCPDPDLYQEQADL